MDTDNQHELRMQAHRTAVADTIALWFEDDLRRLDDVMRQCHQRVTPDDTRIFEAAYRAKIGIQRNIEQMATQVILTFTAMLERLEEQGVCLIPDDMLHNHLMHYLTVMGIKMKRLEGATLAAEGWGD